MPSEMPNPRRKSKTTCYAGRMNYARKQKSKDYSGQTPRFSGLFGERYTGQSCGPIQRRPDSRDAMKQTTMTLATAFSFLLFPPFFFSCIILFTIRLFSLSVSQKQHYGESREKEKRKKDVDRTEESEKRAKKKKKTPKDDYEIHEK